MKKILTVIIAILVLVVLIGFILPEKVKIERSTDINTSADTVFQQVNNIKAWEAWGPWFEKDPDMGSVYSDTVEGVNARHCWDSENPEVGKGCLTIIESEANTRIKTQLDFDGQNTGYGSWNFSEADGITTVTWGMEMDMGMNPFGRIMGLFIEGMVAPDFEAGLSKLKDVCEAIPPAKKYPIAIEYMQIESQPIYSIKDSATTFEIGNKLIDLYIELNTHIVTTGAAIAGQPIAIWHKYDPGDYNILETAIPVAETNEGDGRIMAGSIDAGNVVRGIHIGSYHKAARSYMAIEEYVIDKGYVKVGPPWEQYITDPEEVPDTSMWITHIYFRVQ